MSQHLFQTDWNKSRISILMGYDRPLDGYFMVIERIDQDDEEEDLDEESEDDGYIYSNLYEAESHPKSLTRYQQKLTELGIEVPTQMLEEIVQDRAQNIGNKRVLHTMVNGKYSRQSSE